MRKIEKLADVELMSNAHTLQVLQRRERCSEMSRYDDVYVPLVGCLRGSARYYNVSRL